MILRDSTVLTFQPHVMLSSHIECTVNGFSRSKGKSFLPFQEWYVSRNSSFGNMAYVSRWEWGSEFKSFKCVEIFFGRLGNIEV